MEIASQAGPYTVRFCERVSDAGIKIAPEGPYHLVVDERVANLYSSELAELQSRALSVLPLEATESVKSLEEVPRIVAKLAEARIRRDHTLVAIGGGIIQDLTCFIASMLFRGIKWAFLPTTLLAQADSCIGSKSSINAAGVKNLVGNFYPPTKIVVASDFLATLNERELRSGIGEIIKVHIIDGPESFDRLAQAFDLLPDDPDVMQKFIHRSLEIKKRLIEIDEFDRGPRMVMNYGHSFGHAIEAATNYAVPHGIAVTIGADMANFMAVSLGRMAFHHFNRMHLTLRKNYRGFETLALPAQAILDSLSRDKKNVGQDLVLILPDENAHVQRVRVPLSNEFALFLERYLESLNAPIVGPA